jgi:hypothetical protein
MLLRKNVPLSVKHCKILKKDSVVHCSKEFLQKKIREIGFKWKKCQPNIRLVVESHTIVFKGIKD